MSRRQPAAEPPRSAAEVARRFADAYNAAAVSEDPGAPLAAVATPTAMAGYLVESQSGVVAPLASRTAVPLHARLEIDPARAQAPFAGLVVAPSPATASLARTSSAKSSSTWNKTGSPGSCSAPPDATIESPRRKGGLA